MDDHSEIWRQYYQKALEKTQKKPALRARLFHSNMN